MCFFQNKPVHINLTLNCHYMNKLKILNYLISFINESKGCRYYYIGITKNPENRIKKHKLYNNLNFMYSLVKLDYQTAKLMEKTIYNKYNVDYHLLNK